MKIAPNQDSLGLGHVPIFGALDGFRGLLAVFVAIYHTYWFSHINRSAFFEHGPVIIDLFFVFSGFLMFTLYGRKIRNLQDGKRFIRKRFARLYPLHLFVLCLFIVFASLRVLLHAIGVATLETGEKLPFHPGAPESVSTLLSNLTLTHAMGVHDYNTFNVPSWTISVEFFAYFIFTAMLIWLRPRKNWHFGLIAVLVGLSYVLLSKVKPDMNITYDYAFLRCLGGFYTGVLVAHVFKFLQKSAYINSLSIAVASMIEVFVLLVSILFVIYCPGKLQFLVAPILFLFVLVFAFDKGLVSRFMMAKLFRYLARISYSVYMVHMIVAIVFYAVANVVMTPILGEGWFEFGINGDLFLMPYLAVVIIFAHFTHLFVEAPGHKALLSNGPFFTKTALSKS